MQALTGTDVARMRDQLFFEGPERSRRLSRFWLLLPLSAVIAAAGVISDSTATVIGAMIVAPLMTPIVGTSLAVVLGDRDNLWRSLLLIVSGGINIAPSEIERALLAHPAVSAAGVCGVPDRVYGEGVHAAVTLRPGADASAEELMTWCRAHLASVKKPRSIVFVDELPVSSTGKLLRRVLRERYTEA